ncbi:hypothetical protein MAR_035475 [Mya arenaria]|uniref:Uncharacterized protein n=1 Tax=Mya arenaria TaxID=6604 RepID=A0ABY7EPR4_MYAAR|nr:hypothetical protein MAR_035475 [Mya arenaria]
MSFAVVRMVGRVVIRSSVYARLQRAINMMMP